MGTHIKQWNGYTVYNHIQNNISQQINIKTNWIYAKRGTGMRYCGSGPIIGLWLRCCIIKCPRMKLTDWWLMCVCVQNSWRGSNPITLPTFKALAKFGHTIMQCQIILLKMSKHFEQYIVLNTIIKHFIHLKTYTYTYIIIYSRCLYLICCYDGDDGDGNC